MLLPQLLSEMECDERPGIGWGKSQPCDFNPLLEGRKEIGVPLHTWYNSVGVAFTCMNLSTGEAGVTRLYALNFT